MILSFSRNKELSFNLLMITGFTIIAIGFAVITGWFLNISILESVFANYVTMKFNTALCFILSGTAFILLVVYKGAFTKTLCRIITLCFGILAVITLLQSLFPYPVGVDQFFFSDVVSAKANLPFPGRMAQATAFCFSLLAISFFLIDAINLNFRIAAQYILHTITFISFISITGFLLKVPYTQKFTFFSSMAIHTSLGLFALSIAASSINYTLGLSRLFAGTGPGHMIARRLFPAMAVILILISFVSIELQRSHFISPEFGIVVSTIFFLLVGMFLIRDTVTGINQMDLKRSIAENETIALNKNLEAIVQQRTIELEESNNRFRKIFDANPITIAMTDMETGKYADVNPELVKFLNYKREEIIGHTASELGIITPEFRQWMIDSITDKGYIRNAEVVLKAKDQQEKHCLLSAEVLETASGRYLMSFVYDITTRKLVEDRLQEAKKGLDVLTDKLTKQNKQLTSFAHIISHNLRSPVSNLNLLVHFYKESTSAEDKEELWSNFETVTGHLNTTLDELLETLKIQEDINKERETLSFEVVFNQISEMLVGQIRESKAVIRTDFSRASSVSYPKIYLESIMLNLISNAIKYKSPKRTPEITIKTEQVNGETILTVIDNGLGIDLVRHGKNLFGMRKTFHRHAEAKGIGLFITKTQIEAMGGEISAESAVDFGTTFKVIFNKKQL